MEEHPAEAFLTFALKQIVTIPDQVAVVRTESERGIELNVTVAPVDLGRAIGREGSIARSLRTLVKMIGTMHGTSINLHINDPRERIR